MNERYTIASHFAVGLFDSGKFNAVYGHWDQGQAELFYVLNRFVDYTDMLGEAGSAAVDGFPGSYLYEVAEPFGYWFGAHILARPAGADVDEDAGRAALRDLAYALFLQGCEDDATREKLRLALIAVPGGAA